MPLLKHAFSCSFNSSVLLNKALRAPGLDNRVPFSCSFCHLFTGSLARGRRQSWTRRRQCSNQNLHHHLLPMEVQNQNRSYRCCSRMDAQHPMAVAPRNQQHSLLRIQCQMLRSTRGDTRLGKPVLGQQTARSRYVHVQLLVSPTTPRLCGRWGT